MELPQTSTLQTNENETLLVKEHISKPSTTTTNVVAAFSALTIAILAFTAYTYSPKS